MSGHSRWEDVRRDLGLPEIEPRPPSPHRPPYCGECGRRVRRWQSYGGWGPIGFTVRTADVVWHMKCLRRRHGY